MALTPFHGPPAAAPQVPGFVARTLLGFGAHGEVWLAEDLSTGGSVALKIGRRATRDPVVPTGVPPGRPADPGAGLGPETALLCRIDHPHIVRLQRVIQFGGSGLALVLDLASGGSLASLLAARGPCDPGEVSTLLVPLAGALEHLHRRGVVHGDIAPGNVLLTADGRPQLGDLGAARILAARGTDTWSTPGFSDPATTGGTGRVDPRAADLWSLAAVGWFALTGHPPEPGAAAADPAAGQAPAALVELLVECLDLDPGRRPGLDELADRAWQAAHPTPIRLIGEPAPVGEEFGLPPLSDRITRRVAGSNALSPAGDRVADAVTMPSTTARPSVRRGGVGRFRLARRWWAGRPGRAGLRRLAGEGRRPGRRPATGARRRMSAALAAAGLVAIGLGAITVIEARPSVNLVGSGGTAGAGPATPSLGRSVAGPADREIELSQALEQIGRSRAEAFASVSTARLARADQPGSPAYQADLALVQRLRARGFRLEGVRYEITNVHVLRHRGSALDVAATVTTSGHRQVGQTSSPSQTASRTGTSSPSFRVPEDGPRSLVFTVIAVGPADAGPARWRVRSIQAAS